MSAKRPGSNGTDEKSDEQQPEPDPSEQTHSVEALIEGAQAWLGYSPHLVAGALSGQDKKHMKIDEAIEITRDFAEREIEAPA